MVVYIHVQYMGGNHQIVHANHSHGHHATLTRGKDDQTLQQTGLDFTLSETNSSLLKMGWLEGHDPFPFWVSAYFQG